VVIALARGEDERVRELVAEHDRRCSDAGASVFESDFRSLRAMVLDPKSDRDGRTPPAEIITGAQVADYAEWAGWLGPVVDRVLADPGREQLVVALEALRGPGAMKRFPPRAGSGRALGRPPRDARRRARTGGRVLDARREPGRCLRAGLRDSGDRARTRRARRRSGGGGADARPGYLRAPRRGAVAYACASGRGRVGACRLTARWPAVTSSASAGGGGARGAPLAGPRRALGG
jgi:hypothetical protein